MKKPNKREIAKINYLLKNGWVRDESYRTTQWSHPKLDGWGCMFPLSEAIKVQKSMEEPKERLFTDPI